MITRFKPNNSAVAVVFLLGTLLSLMVFMTIRNSALDRFSLVFQRQAKDRALTLSREMDLHRYELDSLHRFYEQSVEVTKQEFAAYTEPMLKHPCVQSMEWIPLVRRSEREGFEERTEIQILEQGADGQLIPARERTEYFPIEMAAPFKLNEAALGFDLGSNPVRLAALESARDQGVGSSMELVNLVENPTAPAVYMAVYPVYHGSQETLEDRRRNLKGFVLGMYRIGGLIEHTLEQLSVQGLAFLLEDLDAPPENRMLYRHSPRTGTFDWASVQEIPFIHEELVYEAGRTWRVTVWPNDDFSQTHLSRSYLWILPVGLLLTFLVALLLRMQLRGRLQAEFLVQERTADLKESKSNFEAITNQSTIGITVADLEGNYTFVNPAFCKMMGYSNEELLQMSVFDVKAKGQDHSSFAKSKTSEEGSSLQVVLARKDDTEFVSEVVGKRVSIADEKRVLGIVRDITLRHRAETALQESEARYRDLAENTSAILWEYDIGADRWVYMAPQSERILGYAPEEWTNFEFWASHLHEEDRERVVSHCGDCTERGESHELEYRFYKKNGEVIWLRDIVDVKMEEGNASRLCGLMIDVTTHKQTEEALGASEERFRTFFENSSDAMLIIENGKFSSCNTAAATMLGYDKAVDILHVHPAFLSPELQPDGRNSAEKAEEMMAEAVAHGSHRFEWEHLRKDESGCPVEIVLTAIVEDAGTKLHVVWRDLKDRKAAEEALRSSEQKYRLMATNTLDVIWTADLGFKVTFVNDAIYQLLDYTPEEFVGLSLSEFTTQEFLKPIQHEAEQLMASYKEGRISQRKLEVQQIRKDGTLLDVELRANLLLDSDGQITGFQGRSVNITDRKQAEVALQENEAKLIEAQHIARLGRWDLDFVNNTLDWSDEIYALLEISREEYSPNYETMLSFIHPADRELLDRTFQKARENKTNYELEHRLLMPDGRIKWVNELGRFEYDDQGEAFRGFGTTQDVTDRKHAKEALERSGSLLASVIESPDSIIIFALDRNFTYLSFNQAHVREMKRVYDADIEIGQEILAYISREDDHSNALDNYERVLNGERFVKIEEYGESDNRSWYELSFNPIQDESKDISGLTVFVVDITERKKTEEALEKSEKSYRLLAENSTDTIWLMQLDGTFLYHSPAVMQLRGYTPEEANKVSMQESMTPHSMVVLEELFAREAAKPMKEQWDSLRFELEMFRKDGSRIWTEVTTKSVFNVDGQVVGIQGATHDITDRKEAAQEKERLLAAIDQAAESIVITDAEGAIEYVNPAFERTTGYAREEAIGQNPRILRSGEHEDAFYQSMWRTLLQGETWTGRFSNRKKDGTVYTEEATISPVKDSTGKVVNYVAIKTDITIDLLREEQYRQAQKMESVGRLAGGVAHDFNNILQTITGFCGLILAEMDAQSAQRQDVDEIRKAALLAGDLTQQLLTFSRKQPVQYSVINLNTVLSDGANMLRQALDESFHLKFKLDAELRKVNADASQIMQIALNLIVNARDAMPEGGIVTLQTQRLEISPKDPSIWPNAREGEWVCFSVLDNGCGMDEKQLTHLFEPFYTTKQLGKGTGLGLSVVYGIVEEYGGWISVSSEPGTGTVFRICLPVHDDAKPAGIDGLTDLDQFLGKRILLVEDDPVVRELTAEILQDVGYAVSMAVDASEAEQMFSENNRGFDLLFSDVVLPDGNGIELAETFLKQHPELSVLLFSGHSDERARVDLINSNGFHYIRKPFNLKKLLDTVDLAITTGLRSVRAVREE